jgi:hypothetical protein
LLKIERENRKGYIARESPKVGVNNNKKRRCRLKEQDGVQRQRLTIRGRDATMTQQDAEL